MSIFKRAAWCAAMISISLYGLSGCGCSSPASANVQESQTETREETQEPTLVETTEAATTEAPTTEAVTETETEEELSLLDIFRPSTHTDPNTYAWIITNEQYDALQTFDMTPETHDMDFLIQGVMAEIQMTGEENVTDEDVAEIIKYVGEMCQKGFSDNYTQEDFDAETQRILDWFAENEGGYEDENGVWVSAEEHWERTGRTPGGSSNEGQSSIEILDASGTKYAKDSVNVRSEANKDSEKLGSLSWAEEVTITGITSDGKWTRIEFNGGAGFVSSSYLQDTKPQKPTNNGGNGGGSSNENPGSSGSEDTNPGGSSGGGSNSLPAGWEGLGGNGADLSGVDWDAPDRGGDFSGNLRSDMVVQIKKV